MELAWFVGVDWGSQTHQACVSDVAGKLLGERRSSMAARGCRRSDWLLSSGSEQVGVAIETPRGPVVESLMERGFAVHAINPKQLDRFDRISPAGAKDDRRDARCWPRRYAPTRTVCGLERPTQRSSSAGVVAPERGRLRGNAFARRTGCASSSGALPAAARRDQRRCRGVLGARPVAAPADAGCGAARSRSDARQVIETAPHPPVDAATLCDRLRAPAVRVAPGAAEAAAAHVRSSPNASYWSTGNWRTRALDRAPARRGRRLTARRATELATAARRGHPARRCPASHRRPRLSACRGSTRCGGGLRRARCLCRVAPVIRCSGKSLLVVRRLAAHDRLPTPPTTGLALPTADPVSRAKYQGWDTPARCAQWFRPPASPAPCSVDYLLRPAPCRKCSVNS